MTNVMVDKDSRVYGNFEKYEDEYFVDVRDSFFDICSNTNNENYPIKKNNFNLISQRIKVLIEVHSSPFHNFTGTYGAILNALELFQNPLFVINVTHLKSPWCSQNLVAFLYYFLEDNDIDYICVSSEDSVGISINNFYLFRYGDYPIPNAINKIHEKFFKYVKNKNAIPNKKVYLSRRKVTTTSPPAPQDVDLSRIDDEKILEDFFKNEGFEIIYPEDFKSFKEQINYFYEVKTLISISGGGAMNAVFMQKGGDLVELISPLFSLWNYQNSNNNWMISHHNFFSNIAFKRELNYIGISNPEKKANLVIDKILNNKALLSLIKENVDQNFN